jgi:hypothetical protein
MQIRHHMLSERNSVAYCPLSTAAESTLHVDHLLCAKGEVRVRVGVPTFEMHAFRSLSGASRHHDHQQNGRTSVLVDLVDSDGPNIVVVTAWD